MEIGTFNKFKNEMQSFRVLTIVNLVGAGLTIAFAIAFGIGKVLPVILGGPLTFNNIPYLGLIIAGMAFGITWITSSAELMDEHSEIMTELDNVNQDDDETITRLIVKSLALYRENHPKISKLSMGSRVTGIFMLWTCIPQLAALLSGDQMFTGFMLLGQIFGFVCSLGLGLAGLYVPTLLKRYTETWNIRLNMSDEAEKKLKQILEGE